MSITVLNGGLLTTIQDLGRTGYQRFGVPTAGAVDARALISANLLLGNDRNAAGLEITLLGPTLRFDDPSVIAITGGDLSPTIDGTPVETCRAIPVRAGSVLSFGAVRGGCRAYVAFANGINLPVLMGSRSTYIKAKMGGLSGGKLQRDDVLPVQPCGYIPYIAARRIEKPVWTADAVTLRVLMGPEDDAFTDEGIATFLGSEYRLTDQSDRMGCRLDGAKVAHISGGDIITDGISMGAVQIPSAGLPIIMLADRQTTGGYTKIANVISADMPLIAQSRPGDAVRFRRVEIEEAQRLCLEECAYFDAMEKTFRRPQPKAMRVKVNGDWFDVTIEEKTE